jgi:ketosteroid isomerase-like protein
MTLPAYWRTGFLLVAFSLAATQSPAAAASVQTTAIVDTIRRDVAQLVEGLNAHDALKTTAYDAANVISIECGSSSTVGIDADREGFAQGFARDPDWRVSLIDETVDVAGSGDLAVYRGIYDEDHRRAGVLMTHKTNFIAEFKRQSDGSFKMVWYIVANMEPSHRK